MFFQTRSRDAIKMQHPSATTSEILKIMSDKWEMADERTKKEFEALAEEDKVRYSRELDAYVAKFGALPQPKRRKKAGSVKREERPQEQQQGGSDKKPVKKRKVVVKAASDAGAGQEQTVGVASALEKAADESKQVVDETKQVEDQSKLVENESKQVEDAHVSNNVEAAPVEAAPLQNAPESIQHQDASDERPQISFANVETPERQESLPERGLE